MWARAPGLPLIYFVISQVKSLPFQVFVFYYKSQLCFAFSIIQLKEYHGYDGVRGMRRLRKLEYCYSSTPVGTCHITSYRENNTISPHARALRKCMKVKRCFQRKQRYMYTVLYSAENKYFNVLGFSEHKQNCIK